jgi:hypothetical protein
MALYSRRPIQNALVTVALLLLLGPSHIIAMTTNLNQTPREFQWSAINSSGSPSPRYDHVAVWTGREMLVWGGVGCSRWCNDGARYDPATDSWAPISNDGAPSRRSGARAVWTGREMFVWGGSGDELLSDRAAYDPIRDRWRQLPAAPLEPRYLHTLVWTGVEAIVWGGIDKYGTPYADGAAYDPVGDNWRLITTTSAPAARFSHSAVWTGAEMIVWGGALGFRSGGRYDPLADAWRSVTRDGTPSGRADHVGVWTGSEMLVWGGAYLRRENPFGDGARYDPTTESWRAMSAPALIGPRQNYTGVWTGTELIVFGGSEFLGRDDPCDPAGFPYGGIYTPSLDTWTPLPCPPPGVAPRILHTAVWADGEMLVWGGAGQASRQPSATEPATATGARLRPTQ